MADVTFVDGIKPKRNEGAPDWAVLKQTIYRDKFISWLQEQPEDIIYIETLVSKSSGSLYTKIDNDTREFQKRVREEEMAKAKAAVSEAKPQQDIGDFSDDIPF